MCGVVAQLVEHCTGIAEVLGSNLVEALFFSRLLSNCLNCLNWKIYGDDHSSLSAFPWLVVCFCQLQRKQSFHASMLGDLQYKQEAVGSLYSCAS